MPRLTRWARRRVALFALPLLLLAVPLVGAQASGPIDCKAVHDGGRQWQWVALPDGVSNPTGFAVDYLKPNRLLVSNSSQIYVSDDHGCSWTTAVSLTTLADDAGYSSAISRIVDVGFSLEGYAIATISEGIGAEARPHVVRSRTGSRGTWVTSDTGLPAVGEPRSMGVGVFGFVIGIAQFGSGVVGGGGLPGGIGGTDPTGQIPAMVYTSDDGKTWAVGAGVSAFDGQRVISQIAGDLISPMGVYAVAGGSLYVSQDRGRTFRKAALPGTPTALAPSNSTELGVFGSSFAARSTNGGRSFRAMKAVSGARSAAWRTDGTYLVATSDKVFRSTGSKVTDVTPDGYPGGTPTMRSTFVGEDTWYVTAGKRLYRWFDTYKPAKQPPGVPNERISFPPPAGSISPARPVLNLRPGGTRTQQYTLHLPKSPTPIDVYYLFDVSGSMLSLIDDLRKNAKVIGVELAKQGVNINEGVGAIGTAPNLKAGAPPDPPTNPNPNDPRGPYRQPVLYKRWAPVGAVNQNFFDALNKLQPEYYIGQAAPCPPTATDWNGCEQHPEGVLVSLVQSVTGAGLSSPDLPVPVAPGQAAEFRQSEDTRRVIVLATDEKFWAPPGTPMTAEGRPDLAKVAKLLREHDIRVIGLNNDTYESREDLRTMARLTNTIAPKGGLPCRYGDEGKVIPEGQPVVCENRTGVATVIQRLLSALPDFQRVSVAVGRTSPVFRGIGNGLFPKVNVKNVFDGEFTATYSCAGVPSGSYAVPINAFLRGYKVATTVATVNCGASLVPPVSKTDPVPVAQNPPGNPAPPPPAPIPAQPVTQVQSQVQTQVQVNPQVGAAAQQEEQLQLALAQAGLFTVDDDEKVTQQAMSRRDQERAAHAVLAAALAASSVLGLAMMRRQRTQDAMRVTPVWARRR